MKKDVTLRRQIESWLKNTKNRAISVGFFLDASDYVAMRNEAVGHFKLMCGEGRQADEG